MKMGNRGFADISLCKEGIAVLRMDRPPVNAITIELLHDVMGVLRALQDDSQTKVLVLTGSGPCFSAGLDLKVIPGYGHEQQRELVDSINRLLHLLYAFPRPTVAAVNGHAIAGGFFPVIACDHRICTTSPCELGLTEALVGLTFPISCIELLRWELPGAASRKLVLTGNTVGPREALQLGVVDELAPAEGLMERALEVASQLGSLPLSGFARLKQQLRREPLSRMEDAVLQGNDPQMEAEWMTEEARRAARELLRRNRE